MEKVSYLEHEVEEGKVLTLEIEDEAARKEISGMKTKLDEFQEEVENCDICGIATGNTVDITDSGLPPFNDLTLYGESKQVQTTGKNLLQNTAKTQTVNGVTFTINDDKSIKTSGSKTGTSNVICNIGTFTAKAGIDYTCSYLTPNDTEVADNYMQLHTADFSIIRYVTKISTLSFEEDTVLNVRMIVDSTTGKTYYPMIRLASVTDSTYEPYSGGKASPSPDFPQPIESKIVNRIDVLGKNLLRFSQGSTTNNGITFTVNADKSVTVNGTATADSVLLLTTSTRGEVDLKRLTGKNIILSGCPNGGSSSTYKFQFWSDSKMAVDTGNGATLDLSTVPDTWNFAISIIGGTTVNNLTFKPMIRDASITDATYEPYQSQTVNLSAPIELNGIGGVRDSDKVKNIYVKVFTGNESFRTYTPGVGGIQFGCEDENIMQIESENVLCTHLPPKFTWNVREDGIALTSSSSVVVRFRMESLGISTIEDLKAKLKEWYNAGNPMILYAPIKTPIETTIPQVDIDAIKALHSYKPNTVVINDANALMDVQYFKNTENGAAAGLIKEHTVDKNNPHGVTKSQVGLSNVPNVATNDQTPTYTESSNLVELTSGEKLSVAMGKIAKAVKSLISHIGNKKNPHGVTKAQIGLAGVPNIHILESSVDKDSGIFSYNFNSLVDSSFHQGCFVEVYVFKNGAFTNLIKPNYISIDASSSLGLVTLTVGFEETFKEETPIKIVYWE